MSFDLKIRLPKGFTPPVPTVEMPPLKRDRDRTEEENLLWQKKKYEQALERAKDSAWAPYSTSFPTRSMVLIAEVFRRAGATFSSSATSRDKKGATLPRGPGGEVDARKFGSNAGWLVNPPECAFIAERLGAWLDGGGAVFQLADFSWDLTPAAKDKDDLKTRMFLYELSAFFSRAAQHGGVEVW